MKNLSKLFLALVFTCGIYSELFSQITKDLEIENTHSKILCDFDNFNSLHIGYYGTTENCKRYFIYGFKYKKSWLLVANKNDKITLLVCNPPRQKEKDKIVPGSTLLLESVSRTYLNKYLKFKDRKKETKEIDIRGFYKFNRYGKKAMKGMLYLDYPKTKIEKENERELPWPFSIFQKDEEEVKEDVNEETEKQLSEGVEGITKPIELAKPEIALPN